jgi:LDH2 family malate/lactate/ureidoglycolate dehydrogenase
MEEYLVDAEKLKSFVKRIFIALNVPQEDAEVTADVLVNADLRGIESHGVARIMRYVGRIRDKLIEPKPKINIVSETQSTILIDGGNGLGQVVGALAMRRCIAKAKNTGVCIASVRNSNHYGIAGYYAMMALKEDMIGISLTNTYPLVSPTYGRRALIGTNPIAVAVPTKNETPFVLDMATSVVPIGKIEVYSRRGYKAPIGWGRDLEGRDTTDPKAILQGGTLLPLGGTEEHAGYKGYGLAVLVDILTGVLSGGAFGLYVGRPDEPIPSKIAHFFGAINIDSFVNKEEFKERMDAMVRCIKDSPKTPGHNRIFLAGEIEAETEKRRKVEGIPMHKKVYETLLCLANEFGLNIDILKSD